MSQEGSVEFKYKRKWFATAVVIRQAVLLFSIHYLWRLKKSGLLTFIVINTKKTQSVTANVEKQ